MCQENSEQIGLRGEDGRGRACRTPCVKSANWGIKGSRRWDPAAHPGSVSRRGWGGDGIKGTDLLLKDIQTTKGLGGGRGCRGTVCCLALGTPFWWNLMFDSPIVAALDFVSGGRGMNGGNRRGKAKGPRLSSEWSGGGMKRG